MCTDSIPVPKKKKPLVAVIRIFFLIKELEVAIYGG